MMKDVFSTFHFSCGFLCILSSAGDDECSITNALCGFLSLAACPYIIITFKKFEYCTRYSILLQRIDSLLISIQIHYIYALSD